MRKTFLYGAAFNMALELNQSNKTARELLDRMDKEGLGLSKRKTNSQKK